MKNSRANSSRKWGDDGSEDGAKQPPPAVLRHPSDGDQSEALSPAELERMHTEMILALTNDGANSVYSGSAAAAPPPPVDGLLRDEHIPLDESYDERLAQEIQQQGEYPTALTNNSSYEDRMAKKQRDVYGDDLSSLDPMEHSAEILALTGGGGYSSESGSKSIESGGSNRSPSSRTGRGSTKFDAASGTAARISTGSYIESNSSNIRGSSSRAGRGADRGSTKFDAASGTAARISGGSSIGSSSNSRGSSSRTNRGSERGSCKFDATSGTSARVSADSPYPPPPGALTSSTTSSAAASPSMRLLRPSQSLSFSKSALASVDRRESGRSVPGAYVVEGMHASGSDDDHSVIHEGDEEEDMSMAVQERTSAQRATISSTFADEEPSTPFFQDEETPISGPSFQEAQVEQAGILSQHSSRKYPARRRRFVIIGVLLVVIVAVVVAAVVATGGGDKEDASTDEATPPLPSEDTPAPTTAPTTFVCSAQAIYLECQGGASMFQNSSIPGCVSELYQTYRESFLAQIDPTIQDLELTSCAPQNLALYALASTEETESIRTKYILNVLYFSTNGHLWKDGTNWLSSAPTCSWFGVICATDELVRELALVDNDLSGTLPPVIGLLDTLLKLNLGRNNLMSPIPSELSNLQDLDVLDLSRASLDPGPIPAPILNLSKLSSLDLSSTDRTGILPEELNALTLLNSLVLENNSFNGTLPSDLFFLPFLRVLELGSNDLTGSIPNETGSAQLMIRLGLERNKLVGPMPTSIGMMTSLAIFTFSNNVFSGLIPLEVCGLWNHSLTTFGAPVAECQGSRPSFYGNLECPSRECCQNCESVFQG